MKKGIKQSLFISGILAGCLAIGVAATVGIAHGYNNIDSARADAFTLTLNSSKTPSSLTSSYQDSVATTIKSTNGYDLNVTFVLAKTSSGNFVQLANRGMIYMTDKVMGLTAITVDTTSGSVFYKGATTDIATNGVFMGGRVALGDNVRYPVEPTDRFQLMAGDSGAIISSIKLEYSCSTAIQTTKSLNGKYTGKGSDNYRYSLELNNGNATLKTLDKVPAVIKTGTISYTNGQLVTTFTNLVLTHTVSADKSTLTYVSKSGSDASSFPTITFNRVYVVEDFESYTESGVGWRQASNSQYNGTGVRAHYYADYGGGGTSGYPSRLTSGWDLMGSGDYMQFSSTISHGGSNSVAFKGNSSNCRYIQINAIYGVPEVIGKGAKLSFWAKGAYSENTLTTEGANNSVVKVLMYYNSKVDSTNVTVRTEKTFTIYAYSGWKEYTMDLDSSKNYFAFGINCSTGGTYTPIDDVCIYTTSPYDNINYPEGTYTASVKVSSYSVPFLLAFSSDGKYAARVGNEPLEDLATSFTYDAVTKEFKIVTSGTKDARYSNSVTIHITPGTIYGKYDGTKIVNAGFQNYTLKVNSSSTTYSISNNGSLSLTKPSMYWDCNSNLTDVFVRRYNSGSWQIDTGNSDRLVANTSTAIGGSGLTVRAYASGKVGLTFNESYSSNGLPKYGFKNVGFWVYNPNDAFTMSLYIYRATNYGSHDNFANVNIAGHGWTMITVGTGANYNYSTSSNKMYNFQFYYESLAKPLTFDNIVFFTN